MSEPRPGAPEREQRAGSSRLLTVVVLVSGRGTNLQSLLDHAGSRLPIRIAAVVSNVAGAPALARARGAGIPTEVVSHRGWPSREAFDARLAEVVDRHRPGLVVLAGFMRLLTPGFVERFRGRLVNIHPSLLPRFPGLDTHRRALEAGDPEHGASVHFVTEDMDEGPLIIQGRVAVREDDDAETLAARVLSIEHRILPQAVRWFAEGRLRLEGDRALLDGAPALETGQLSEF